MEKVKLTREQIQTIRKIMNNDNVLKLTLNELHRVIDGEYEVEERFKVGDWVASTRTGSITRIEEIVGNEVWGVWSGSGERAYNRKHVLRHATPEEIAEEKQRRWWAKHGREEFELKNMDIIVGESDGYFTVWGIYDGGKNYDVYSHEKRKVERISKSEVKHFRVVCFVEDRKDVDHDN